LAYPWAGHVVQAISSYVLGLTPNASFIWTNLIWLACAFGVVVAITRELGGGRLAQMLSVVWLAFGVNSVGYWGKSFAPAWLGAQRPTLWGDPRFTPWLLKFTVFEQNVFGIGLFAVLLFFLYPTSRNRELSSLLLPVVLLLGSLVVFYPILFPAGALAICMYILIIGLFPNRGSSRAWDHICGLALIVIAMGGFGLTYLDFVTVDRVTGTAFQLSPALKVAGKSIGSTLTLLPFWVAVVVLWERTTTMTPRTTFFLVGTGLGCVGLYVVLYIPNYQNEYKYIFTAAIPLAPFAAVLSERGVKRLGRLRLPLIALGALLLMSQSFQDIRNSRGSNQMVPRTDTRKFELALTSPEDLAAVTASVRRTTPVNSILVTREVSINLVTLTGRATYVPHTLDTIQGYGMTADYFLKSVRGYEAEEIDTRRAVIGELFDGAPDARDRALLRIQGLQRPIVIIASEDTEPALVSWVRSYPGVQEVSVAGSFGAWIIRRQTDPVR